MDFAILKVALAMINETPNDTDLKYVINYLDQSGTGFIDFTYFITFLQDASKTPPEKFKNVSKIISKVANNLRVMIRYPMLIMYSINVYYILIFIELNEDVKSRKEK